MERASTQNGGIHGEWCPIGLINPFDKKVMIYTPENVNPIEQDFGIITGGKVLIGLEIDLRTVFQEIL